MFRSNKKKGFTLVEVLCSITLFAVLFMITLTMQLQALKVEKYNKQINKDALLMEEIKNIMIYNATYDELKRLKVENRHYMDTEGIDFDKLTGKEIMNMFVETKPSKEPYLEINIEDGKVLKINFKFYGKGIDNTTIMECEFYKGKYKR